MASKEVQQAIARSVDEAIDSQWRIIDYRMSGGKHKPRKCYRKNYHDTEKGLIYQYRVQEQDMT